MTNLLIPTLLIVFFIVYLALRYLEKKQPNHKIFTIHKSLHWFYQIIPPLLLLFFFTKNGPALWFMMSVVFIAGFISFISILVRLFKFSKNKIFFLRPVLTIFIAFSFLMLGNSSVKEAKEQTIEIAKSIEKTCKQDNECPETINQSKVGSFISYPVIYKNLGSSFTLYFYQSLDLGTQYSSGVSGDFKTRNM